MIFSLLVIGGAWAFSYGGEVFLWFFFGRFYEENRKMPSQFIVFFTFARDAICGEAKFKAEESAQTGMLKNGCSLANLERERATLPSHCHKSFIKKSSYIFKDFCIRIRR
jgi:hypothetical protein